ncbi:MAG: PDZ domain-containing protein [Verrucomicrobiota bacterium]|nr:PDZ domain-containing protein [Verrucomicrobiota bacterium]
MKTKTLAMIAVLGLLPITGFAQTPPAPPNPSVAPIPPVPPVPPYKDKDKDKDRGPKVPVTFLGVETSSVPRVVSEQLGLAKGFGLVVDYVVPDGPAAAAGVQQNDIIKMFNDQILMEPDQLAKLVRSYPEGTNVTLTILRKNAETKVTVKLGKKEVRQRDHDYGMFNMEDMNEKMQAMNEKMKDFKFDFNSPNFGPDIRETVRNAQREAMRATTEARTQARDEAQRARDQAQRTRDEAQRARDEARRSSREMRLFSRDKGAMKSTTIDLGKATIVFTDDKGEMKIETVNGKKILTAKDPQGRLMFSGPVDNQEELDKVPVEVRQRYDKLENKDLPGVVPNSFVENDENADNDNDNDNDEDSNNDNGDDGDDSIDASGATMQQVSFQTCPHTRTVRNWNIVSI